MLPQHVPLPEMAPCHLTMRNEWSEKFLVFVGPVSACGNIEGMLCSILGDVVHHLTMDNEHSVFCVCWTNSVYDNNVGVLYTFSSILGILAR